MSARIIAAWMRGTAALMLVLVLSTVGLVGIADAQDAASPQGEAAIQTPPLSGDWSNKELWPEVRQGIRGNVSIPDKKAGQMVQTEGESWRQIRNDSLPFWSAVAMAAIIVLLAVFYFVRGRIRIEEGRSGLTLPRFNAFERANHWMMAVSFILLALTGLNLLYGRSVLLPVIGYDAFAVTAGWGKTIHNFVSFAFMIGIAIAFVMWVGKNLPNRYDWIWLKQGGGLFSHTHPPARKFNAGQKILFWLMMLGGLSVSLSGIALLFPFQTSLFADTFGLFDGVFGTDYGARIGPVQEQQYASVWHAIVGVGLIVLAIAHAYLGSLGMEGAFDAMGSGEVDLNWAREHHSIWVEELNEQQADDLGRPPAPAPAE